MSLLMQALKKAERAKQNSLHEEELEKPSEAYDQVLELAPADDTPIPSARQAQLPPSFEAADTLSLEPMASNTPSEPEPPTEPRTEKRAETPPPPPPKPKAKQASRATPPPRSAVSIDPATVRLAVLLGILLLVVGVMGYWYGRARRQQRWPGRPHRCSGAIGARATAGAGTSAGNPPRGTACRACRPSAACPCTGPATRDRPGYQQYQGGAHGYGAAHQSRRAASLPGLERWPAGQRPPAIRDRAAPGDQQPRCATGPGVGRPARTARCTGGRTLRAFAGNQSRRWRGPGWPDQLAPGGCSAKRVEVESHLGPF